MRYWFDTEFIERGAEHPIDLLSIGIVAEDGRELYLENSQADLSKADDWVQANVLPFLKTYPAYTREEIALIVQEFCDPEKYRKPEFWAYYADYDWVVLCQLFGRMIDLPRGWPRYCLDIKQVAWTLGDPKLPKDPEQEHYALADARWNRQAWQFLRDYGNSLGVMVSRASKTG